jgi:hypothetical protein
VATIPTNPHPLARFPASHFSPDRIYRPGDLMSWNSRVRDAWPMALFYKRVAVAYPTSLNFNLYPTDARLGNLPLDKLERSARTWNLSCAHLRHSFLQSEFMIYYTNLGVNSVPER